MNHETMIDTINGFLAAWDSIDPRACAIAISKLRKISVAATPIVTVRIESGSRAALTYQREPTV